MNELTTPVPADIAADSTKFRALELLGNNISQEVVASALGVSASYISQLMSQDVFSSLVAERRFKQLSAHNLRDNKYDALEDTLLDKLTQAAPMMYRPGELLAAIRVINGAQRRGSSAPDALTTKAPVREITLPTKIVQQFTTNINNQILVAGTQDLTTIQSGAVGNLVDQVLGAKNDNTREGSSPRANTPEISG